MLSQQLNSIPLIYRASCVPSDWQVQTRLQKPAQSRYFADPQNPHSSMRVHVACDSFRCLAAAQLHVQTCTIIIKQQAIHNTQPPRDCIQPPEMTSRGDQQHALVRCFAVLSFRSSASAGVEPTIRECRQDIGSPVKVHRGRYWAADWIAEQSEP